jgi:hypothetical protein
MTAVVSSCSHLPMGNLTTLNTVPTKRPVPFPLPKKLGSDRLLLVSKALHEIPTYKSISPELQKQKLSLRSSSHHSRQQQPQPKRVHFRAVDQIHEYERAYDESDYSRLWFRPWEVSTIFARDDEDYTVCFSSMAHTKQILQLWGLCSRGNGDTDSAVQSLFQDAPHPRARGLEHRIITGIRNHRQKAVQSFLHQHQEDSSQLCERYLKFSQTAGRFAQALAKGDAWVAKRIQQGEYYEEDDDDDGWGC